MLAVASQIPIGTGDVMIELYDAAMQKLGTSTGQMHRSVEVAAELPLGYFIRVVGTNIKGAVAVGLRRRGEQSCRLEDGKRGQHECDGKRWSGARKFSHIGQRRRCASVVSAAGDWRRR